MFWHNQAIYCKTCNEVYVVSAFIELPMLVCPENNEHEVIAISNDDYAIWKHNGERLMDKYATREERVHQILGRLQEAVDQAQEVCPNYVPTTIADRLISVMPIEKGDLPIYEGSD